MKWQLRNEKGLIWALFLVLLRSSTLPSESRKEEVKAFSYIEIVQSYSDAHIYNFFETNTLKTLSIEVEFAILLRQVLSI